LIGRSGTSVRQGTRDPKCFRRPVKRVS